MSKQKKSRIKPPKLNGWQTTDEDEIAVRQYRAITEKMQVERCEKEQPYFANYRVTSKTSERSYRVEIRDLVEPRNTCECRDYQHNGLGTCKHIEKVLLQLQKLGKRKFKQAAEIGSNRIEIYADRRFEQDGLIYVAWPQQARPSKAQQSLQSLFDSKQQLLGNLKHALPALHRAIKDLPGASRRKVRLSFDIDDAASYQLQQQAKAQHKQHFLNDVQQGKRSLHVLTHRLYPYQEQGMLHLAFNERALLADEMGLGKTIQAIAACELLRRLQGVKRVLIVATASLKAEWQEQINTFCHLPITIIQGSRAERLRQYQQDSFFYISNYEQIMRDHAVINQRLAPDIVVLDEAQRIKNWRTKTADAVKQLQSRYAFVLTGTPLENRIDDVYSIVQFLDPHVFGPLFRFNRDFYQLDNRGKPDGYKNLDQLKQRLRPILLRRTKSDVEGELPERINKTYFVSMHDEQCARYKDYEDSMARIANIAKKRPLTKEEFEKLQLLLSCMRMMCDTPYITDEDCTVCPKLDELSNVFNELLADSSNKIIIFSEWERMLKLIARRADSLNINYAWHTGSVPQAKRRGQINRFKQDENCRLFLSTDAGSVGLNLQCANIVINMDLPWNPAKLEQRIARAWRKHQQRTVTVINFVSEDSIEHRMLEVLKQKQALADSVLNDDTNITDMPMPSGRGALLQRLEELLQPGVAADSSPITETSAEKQADPIQQFSDDVLARFPDQVDRVSQFTRHDGEHSVLAVVDNQQQAAAQFMQQYNRSHEQAVDHLNVIDRDTFNTIQQLIDAGILKLNPEHKDLFNTTTHDETSHQQHAYWQTQARNHLQQAARSTKLAGHLLSGDFCQESLPAIKQALDNSLIAFAWLCGEGEAALEQFDITFIDERLVNIHQMTTHIKPLYPLFDTNITQVDDAQIKDWFNLLQVVYRFVDEKITQQSIAKQSLQA